MVALRDRGAAGIVLPRNALAGSGTAVWRSAIYDGGQFRDVALLVNTGGWVFDDVHAQYTVGLTSIRRGADLPKTVSMRGPFHSLLSFEAGIQKDPLTFPAAEFRTWAAGGAFPILPDAAAAQVFIRLRAHPRLDATTGEWAFRPVQGDFNAATDKHQWDPDVSAAHGDMPVYKGATINLWQPDTGTYLGWATASHVLPVLQEKRKRAARLARSAFYGMPVADQASLPCLSPRIAFRNVTRATDSRTMIVALVPPQVILTHGIPFLLQRAGDASDTLTCSVSCASIPLDWYARRVVEINLVFEILNAFPIPRPRPDDLLRRRVVEIAGRLAAVDQRYAGWAAEVGVPVGSVTDQATKDDLIAELDALVALLYGLDKSDVEHIFATFHRGWDYQPRLAAARPLRPMGSRTAGGGGPVTSPSPEDADFRPTFATNRPSTGETVADALNALLHGMRTNLAVTPPVAIATAFFNPGGFRLLADELEQVGPVRLLLGAEPDPDEGPGCGRWPPGGGGRPTGSSSAGPWKATAATWPRTGTWSGSPARPTPTPGVWWRGCAARRPARRRHRALRWRSAVTPAGSCTARRSSSSTVLPHVMSGSSNFTYAGLAQQPRAEPRPVQPAPSGARSATGSRSCGPSPSRMTWPRSTRPAGRRTCRGMCSCGCCGSCTARRSRRKQQPGRSPASG